MEGKAVVVTTVEQGRPAKHAEKIRDALAALEGQQVKITIEKYRKRRSSNQNAYYWAVVIPFIRAMLRGSNPGATNEDAHNLCKSEKVGNLQAFDVVPITNQNTGQVSTYIIPTTKSTSTLNTMEFEAFLERIRQWALELGVIIPLPNEELDQYYVEPQEL